MKTIQMKSISILATIALMLFTGAKLLANADINPNPSGCDNNWALQISYGTDFTGPTRCLPKGTHPFRAGSMGYPRSLKLRRGYYAIFKKNGRVVLTAKRDYRNTGGLQFDEVLVMRKFSKPSHSRYPWRRNRSAR